MSLLFLYSLYDIDYGNIYFNNRLINKGFNEKDYHKYKKDTYILFDCLYDKNAEQIDAYSLFLHI